MYITFKYKESIPLLFQVRTMERQAATQEGISLAHIPRYKQSPKDLRAEVVDPSSRLILVGESHNQDHSSQHRSNARKILEYIASEGRPFQVGVEYFDRALKHQMEGATTSFLHNLCVEEYGQEGLREILPILEFAMQRRARIFPINQSVLKYEHLEKRDKISRSLETELRKADGNTLTVALLGNIYLEDGLRLQDTVQCPGKSKVSIAQDKSYQKGIYRIGNLREFELDTHL